MKKLLQARPSLEAVVALNGNHHFEAIMTDLADYVADRNKMLIYSNDTNTLPSQQGYLRGLVDFITGIEEAPARLKQLQDGYTDGSA